MDAPPVSTPTRTPLTPQTVRISKEFRNGGQERAAARQSHEGEVRRRRRAEVRW